MDKETIDHIRLLTRRDTKSLSQKALKCCEEVGELASVVLPFENAHATTHRFVDRSAILEEVADTVLSALSVAYDLGFDDEEVNEMIDRKILKWADLQNRHDRAAFPIPYEIHVTVAVANLDQFRAVCRALGVKPIILDLHSRQGEVAKDVMTSSVFFGDNRTAYEEMRRIADGLRRAGFEVVREKIETIPSHPAAPSREDQQAGMPPNCYFECHFNVVCDDARREALFAIAKENDAHISRNVFKDLGNGAYIVMVTARSYSMVIEDFHVWIAKVKVAMEKAGFAVEKETIEFSIYDTKQSHDSAWLRG
jgi:hypothetical protein